MTRALTVSCRGRQPGARRQRGAMTLLVSAVLFLMAMLILLYVNRGAIAEQRMSANERRAKEAFAHAVAGIDHALAYMRDGGIDQNGDDAPDPVVGARYRTAYCSLAVEPPACNATYDAAMACTPPAAPADVLAWSCGWSDDNGSVQRVIQHLRGSASTAGNASTPLVSRGATDLLTGGASVFNYYNDLTVWSGGALLGQSNTGKTFIRDPATTATDPRDTGQSPGCNNPPEGYTCTTQGSTVGHDVVYGDTTLSAATTDQYFERFFGKTPDVYKDTVVLDRFQIEPGQLDALGDEANGNVIWVTGDVTVSQDLGTPERPVILIVDGSLSFSGSPEINGMVFSMGPFSSPGSPTIYGSLITADTASATGNVKIIYDPNVIGAVSNIGRAAKVAGTFRDW